MSTHADEFKADALPDLFTQFGETLFYQAAGAAEVELTGIAEATQTQGDHDEMSGTIEQLDVTVLRDPDDADNSGIAGPAIGDSIRRGIDDSEHIFDYSGQVIFSDAKHWTLRFTRRLPYQHGRGQTRG